MVKITYLGMMMLLGLTNAPANLLIGNVVNKEDLIKLCIDSYVPYKLWHNRDSYSAQKNVSNIYKLLNVGVPYAFDVEGDFIRLEFSDVYQYFDKIETVSFDIDSREDYLNENPDVEMFDGSSIYECGDSYFGYLPTRNRLARYAGMDWY